MWNKIKEVMAKIKQVAITIYNTIEGYVLQSIDGIGENIKKVFVGLLNVITLAVKVCFLGLTALGLYYIGVFLYNVAIYILSLA